MRVILHGPNLNSSAQRKGTFHVHTVDCADNKQYGPGRKYGGEDRGMMVEVSSVDNVVEFIYADMLNEHPEDEREQLLSDWASDFHFAPCVPKFPA